MSTTTTAIPAAPIPTPGPLGRLWGSCFAALYGPLLWRTERRGNASRRAHLLRHAEGTVVEIGAGSRQITCAVTLAFGLSLGPQRNSC
jgi:hypothetical protein